MARLMCPYLDWARQLPDRTDYRCIKSLVTPFFYVNGAIAGAVK